MIEKRIKGVLAILLRSLEVPIGQVLVIRVIGRNLAEVHRGERSKACILIDL